MKTKVFILEMDSYVPSETHYKVQCKCRNCGIKSEVSIEKGTPVRDGECPNCGKSGFLHKISN